MIELNEIYFVDVLKDIIIKSTIIIIPVTILIFIGYILFLLITKKSLDREFLKVFIRIILFDLFLIGLNIPLFFYYYMLIAVIIILIIAIITIINIIRNNLKCKERIKIFNKVSLAIIIVITVLYFIPNVRFPILFKGYISYISDESINSIPVESNFEPNIQWKDTYTINLNNFSLELPYECYLREEQSDIKVNDTTIKVGDTIIIDDNNTIIVMYLPFDNTVDDSIDEKIHKIMIDRYGESILKSRYYFDKTCMSVDINDLYIFQNMEEAILNFTLLLYKCSLIPYSSYFEFESSKGFVLDRYSEYNNLDGEVSVVDLHLDNQYYRLLFTGKMFTEKDVMDIIYYNFGGGR